MFEKKSQLVKKGGLFNQLIIEKIILFKEISPITMLGLFILIISLISPTFLSFENIKVVIDVVPELGILVLGMTMILICGEIDISVGSVFAFCPIVVGLLAGLGLNIWVCTILSLVLACVIGAIHAILVTKTHINSFIVTLGGMMLWRGLILIFTGGFPPDFPKGGEIVKKILVDDIWIIPIPLSFVYLIVIAIILWMVLNRTRFGNWMFAVGARPDAAISRGININKVKLVNFIIVSFLAGLSGLIQAFRINALLPNAGTGLELTAIAGAVIGGNWMGLGTGSIIGSIIGAVLLRMVSNALISVGIPGYWFHAFLGIVIIGAVILNQSIEKIRAKLKGVRVK